MDNDCRENAFTIVKKKKLEEKLYPEISNVSCTENFDSDSSFSSNTGKNKEKFFQNFSAINDLLKTSNNTVSITEHMCNEEFDLYINKPIPKLSCNILEWWKKRAHLFPHLVVLARDYIAIQATSAASERSFSRANLIITRLRNLCRQQHFKMLYFCVLYLQILEKISSMA